MNRTRNAAIAIAGIVLLIIVGALAHRSPDAVAVRETTVRYATFETKLPETGVVELPRTVTLPAYVAGNLGTILVRAGDRVTRGQLLATIVNDQITSNLSDAEENAAGASGKSESVAETNAALPEQNRANVLQAEAGVVAARSQLTQARQDVAAGAQSGLGYGGTTAQEQRLEADATLSKAQTDFSEAERTYEADKSLYDEKAISHDALMQSHARFVEAQVTYDQARSERGILGGQLTRETQVVHDRLGSARDALLQAEAALAAARANAAESKTGDLEAAQADAGRARADLAFARDQAAKLNIVAPFDGIVQSVASQPNDTLRPLQPGDAVALGQGIFTLAADDNFIVRTKVDEQDVANVAVGQRAIVSGEDFEGRTLGGTVVAISPVAQKSDDPSNTSRQVLTTIRLDRRLPYLRDGMSVDVDIVTHRQPHVIAVPIDAIHSDDRGSFAYVVRGGRATRAALHLGTAGDTTTVVTSGIAPGDVVISEKGPNVSAGTAVKPAPSPSPNQTSPAG